MTTVTDDGQQVLLHDDGTWEAVANAAANDPGIRGVQWGMSQDAVKQVEDRVPKDDDLITFRVRIGGLPAFLEYA